MTTFNPGIKVFIIAFFAAFLATKNGRNLGSKIIHKHIKETILFMLPLRVRCRIVQAIMEMPLEKGRKYMEIATRPWGAQWDYISPVKKANVAGHWISKGSHQFKKERRVLEIERTANEADFTIFYIHGGGFRSGTSIMYTESFIHIIEYLKKTRQLNVRIFSVDYKLMSQGNYYQAKEDCLNGYRYLIDHVKIDPKKIVFAGDSAGGNLVGTCLMAIRDLGLPQPAGNVQISPWVSIDNNKSTRAGKTYVDCLTVKMLKKRDFGNYFHSEPFANKEEEGKALRSPDFSPLYGSLVGLCPTLVTYGGTEVFQHDVEEFIQCLKRDQVKVDVITRQAPHIWLISSILAPTHAMWESDCSKIADWCADCVLNK